MNTCVTTPGRRRHLGVARDEARRFLSARSLSSKSCDHSVVGTSVMPPSNPLGGRLRSSTQPSARTTTNAAPRRSLPSRFGALRGNVCGSPRRRAAQSVHPRAERAGRLHRRADGGAEVHQRLREVAGARVRRQRLRQTMDLRLGRRQFLLDGEQPRHHPLDIAVDRHRAWRRRRSKRSRPRCSARCPAASRAQLRCAESRRAPPPPARRHAGCGRARNSRARPTAAARRRAAPPRASRTSGQRARKRAKYGPTVFTVVCCSMISESHTR